MPFKTSERVIYKKNPLIQVMCQLRFPRILSINEKVPVDFQERIRKTYPIYNVAVEQQQQLIVEPSIDPLPKFIQNEQRNNYSFSSEDYIWRINLTSTFLSLSTLQYERWEDFRSHLQEPLQALIEIYYPAFFERVGLRYVDAFRRSKLNIGAETPWTELISQFALGFLSNNDIAADVKGYSATSEIDLGKNALARIITSTGFVGNMVNPQNGELSFIVDSDLFFNSKKNLNELDISLEYLHEHANRLIRSIITDKLHNAMEPEKI